MAMHNFTNTNLISYTVLTLVLHVGPILNDVGPPSGTSKNGLFMPKQSALPYDVGLGSGTTLYPAYNLMWDHF